MKLESILDMVWCSLNGGAFAVARLWQVSAMFLGV